MDFIKKHYEKILLCGVLLGMVGAIVLMGFVIEADKEKSEEFKNNIINPKVQPLQELDLAAQTNLIERMQAPPEMDFSTTNKLFNPMQWQKDVNGNMIKIKTGHEVGAEAATITKITPFYFSVTLDSVITNEATPRYVIGVENQAAALPAARRPQHHYASVGEKNQVFTLVSITGAPENPDSLVLKLADTGETAVVPKDKPFRRVDGYSADLKYDPEGKKWSSQRAGADLKFAGDDYNIVAIHQNEVVLSAQSNQKRTTLRYAP